MALDHECLRALALAAIAGSPMDTEDSTGAWEPWFNFHGDPYVAEAGRGQWGIVATVATSPVDYGKARAEFMGAADPATVIELLDECAAASRTPTGDDDAQTNAKRGNE